MKSPPLRMERVRVTGLFGLYDHDISLNLDDRVTIIHGPNGVGKTVLLKLIEAIFDGQFEGAIQEIGNGAVRLECPRYRVSRGATPRPVVEIEAV